MYRFWIVLCLVLSGCAKPMTFYCSAPGGMLKAEGFTSYSGVVRLNLEDGGQAVAHLSNCIGVETKK